jgi:type IV pilus assembly protein PilC
MAQKAVTKEKEATFTWTGTDRRGTKIKGETTGRSIAMVKAELRKQGIKPGNVRKKSALFGSSKGKSIKPADIAVFSRQLATMMSSGVPLVQSFDIIAQGQENPNMAKLLLQIKADIESGTTLAEALEKHPLHFDELFCNLVRAGEHAGILENLLHKIATYKERTETIKAKIKKAMFYPTAIMVVAFVVTAILLIYVVPQFEDLFKNFGGELPTLTQMVVDMSEFMQSYWWVVFLGIGGTVYGLIQAKRRSKAFGRFLDRNVLKIPIVGPIVNKAAIARFARTLATMFAAGVPLVDSMKSVAGATGNIVYHDAVMRIREDVSTGRQLQLCMKDAQIFPPMVVQMVAIGEEAGNLDGMLGKVADMYEEAVNNDVDSMSSLLEPLIMAILGVLIGGLVIAMYMPIFQMGAVV